MRTHALVDASVFKLVLIKVKNRSFEVFKQGSPSAAHTPY